MWGVSLLMFQFGSGACFSWQTSATHTA